MVDSRIIHLIEGIDLDTLRGPKKQNITNHDSLIEKNYHTGASDIAAHFP